MVGIKSPANSGKQNKNHKNAYHKKSISQKMHITHKKNQHVQFGSSFEKTCIFLKNTNQMFFIILESWFPFGFSVSISLSPLSPSTLPPLVHARFAGRNEVILWRGLLRHAKCGLLKLLRLTKNTLSSPAAASKRLSYVIRLFFGLDSEQLQSHVRETLSLLSLSLC